MPKNFYLLLYIARLLYAGSKEVTDYTGFPQAASSPKTAIPEPGRTKKSKPNNCPKHPIFNTSWLL